jgi:hypothetical protein
MNNCTHKKPTMFKETQERWCSIIEGWEEVVYEKWEEVSTFEDIDTHRMKCSICGKIDYYSKSARDHYENGIPSPWVR